MSSSEEEEEYEVEKVMGKKGSGSTLKYLIKWKGYQKPTWEPAANCDCKEMIIAYERQNAESSKQKRTAVSDSSDENDVDETPKTPASSSNRGSPIKKKRTVMTPKRRLPASESPSPPRSSRRNLNDSSESEYQAGKNNKRQKLDMSHVQSSSRTPGKKSVNSNAGTPKTPKNTLAGSRTSLRSHNKSSSSSPSASQQPSSSRKKARAAHVKTSPVKGPSKSPRKNPPQSPRAYTPISECDDLAFEIERIDSLVDQNGRKRIMVKTTDGRTKTVDIKAAAKQNTDLVVDFLILRAS